MQTLFLERYRKLVGTSALCLFCSLGARAQTTTPPATTSQAHAATRSTALTPDQKKLLDWPELARYRDGNREVMSSVADKGRVIFFGDSLTYVWNLATFFPGKPYLNRGISGQTTPQMLVRFRPDVIDLKPAVVLILAGTN